MKAQLSELMCKEFLAGWMPTAYSPEFCESLAKEWQNLKQPEPSFMPLPGAQRRTLGAEARAEGEVQAEVAEVVLLPEGREVVPLEGVNLEVLGRGPCSSEQFHGQSTLWGFAWA